MCPDINEQNGFGSRSSIFTSMQADIAPSLNSVLTLMAMYKEANNTKKESNNLHHKESQTTDKMNMQKFTAKRLKENKIQTTTKND